MKLRNVFYIVIIFSIGMGCGSEHQNKPNPPIDPNESALPHGKALPTQSLSKSDIAELKNAKGKKAISISLSKLKKIISVPSKQLQCYVFWSTKCDLCGSVVKELEQKALQSQKISISLITEESDDDALNLFIRQHNIVPKVYQLKAQKDWKKTINPDWDGSLPAILVVDKSNDIHQFYPIKSLNEFEALVSPILP